MIMYVYECDAAQIEDYPAVKTVTYEELKDPASLGEDIEREVNERDGKTVSILIEVVPDDRDQRQVDAERK
jgi:hypothetical protein